MPFSESVSVTIPTGANGQGIDLFIRCMCYVFLFLTVSGDHTLFIVPFRDIAVDGVAYKMLNRAQFTSRSVVNYSSEILEKNLIQTLQLTLLVALVLYNIFASR